MFQTYYFPDNEKFLGVTPHPKAIQVAKYEFFWNCYNELSPFGNKISTLIFTDFNEWMQENPNTSAIQYIQETLEFWELSLKDYNESIIDYENILRMLYDYDFDELVLSVDWSIIAIGFAQFIIKGYIEENIKNITHLAILRQMNSVVLDYLFEEEEFKHLRFVYLTCLLDILENT